MKQYHFLSLQEQGRASWNQTVSDYHPITRQEIISLLAAAATYRKQGDGATVSSIQVRLCQGIRGYASPRLYDGPVSKVSAQVDRLFVENCGLGADPSFVNRMDALIHSLG